MTQKTKLFTTRARMSCCHRRSQTVEILLQTTFKGFHRQHYTQIPQNYERSLQTNDPMNRRTRRLLTNHLTHTGINKYRRRRYKSTSTPILPQFHFTQKQPSTRPYPVIPSGTTEQRHFPKFHPTN